MKQHKGRKLFLEESKGGNRFQRFPPFFAPTFPNREDPSGYLTIKDYDRLDQSCTLGVPNKEVRIGFTEGLLPSVSENHYALAYLKVL